MRILVVEDERKLANALQEGLEDEGYEVALAHSGEDAFFLIHTEEFHLIILDLMLPGRDGLEVLATIRKRGLGTAVLLLTARDTLEDRIAGLDAGADDYLAKPFAFAELLARIGALLRRERSMHMSLLRAADLEMDLITRRVTRAGRMIDLTAREFELLEYLLRHQGKLVMRDTLARDIWKEVSPGTPLNNVIDVHMTRLRRKIDADGAKRLIETIRGMGFILHDEPRTPFPPRAGTKP